MLLSRWNEPLMHDGPRATFRTNLFMHTNFSGNSVPLSWMLSSRAIYFPLFSSLSSPSHQSTLPTLVEMGGQAKRSPISRCAVCNKRCSASCGACQKVFYCSKDHQRSHWQQGHKLACHGAQMVTRSQDCCFGKDSRNVAVSTSSTVAPPPKPKPEDITESTDTSSSKESPIDFESEEQQRKKDEDNDWVTETKPSEFMNEVGWILIT